MRCPIETEETPEVLLAWCAGRLDPAAAAAMTRHAASCPACREAAGGWQRMWQALEEWEAAPVAPDFNRRLYRRIEREDAAPWWQRALRPLGGPLPIAAAAGLLLVAGGLLEQSRPPAGDTQARFEMQADQVERTLEDLELLHSFAREIRQTSTI